MSSDSKTAIDTFEIPSGLEGGDLREFLRQHVAGTSRNPETKNDQVALERESDPVTTTPLAITDVKDRELPDEDDLEAWIAIKQCPRCGKTWQRNVDAVRTHILEGKNCRAPVRASAPVLPVQREESIADETSDDAEGPDSEPESSMISAARTPKPEPEPEPKPEPSKDVTASILGELTPPAAGWTVAGLLYRGLSLGSQYVQGKFRGSISGFDRRIQNDRAEYEKLLGKLVAKYDLKPNLNIQMPPEIQLATKISGDLFAARLEAKMVMGETPIPPKRRDSAKAEGSPTAATPDLVFAGGFSAD